MLVRCKSAVLSEDQVSALGGNIHAQAFDVTEHQMYLVLGLTFYAQSRIHGSGIYLEVEDDSGHLVSVPLFLFDIVDGAPSQYWTSRFWEDGTFAYWPASFFNDCYHDQLSDGVADVRRDYEVVRARLRQEAEVLSSARAN
jgi:hypothetical protein